jgi:hypothetical protein
MQALHHFEDVHRSLDAWLTADAPPAAGRSRAAGHGLRPPGHDLQALRADKRVIDGPGKLKPPAEQLFGTLATDGG